MGVVVVIQRRRYDLDGYPVRSEEIVKAAYGYERVSVDLAVSNGITVERRSRRFKGFALLRGKQCLLALEFEHGGQRQRYVVVAIPTRGSQRNQLRC